VNKRISRRQLLIALAATVGGVGLGKLLSSSVLRGIAQELDKHLYLPLVRKEESPLPGPTAEPTSTSTPTLTPTDTATPTDTPTSTLTPESSATPTAIPTSWPGAGPKVVHVHSTQATFWDFGNNYYGDYVDQDTVNAMVDRGVMELTGAPSLAQAWRILVPNYAPGKAIAIKVNFNNCWSCSQGSGRAAVIVVGILATWSLLMRRQ